VAAARGAIIITGLTCTVAPIAAAPAGIHDGVVSQLAEPRAHDLRPVADVESLRWLSALSDTSPEREDAAERLHALLLRTARFEVARRQRARRGAVDADDLAVQAADDALVAILSKLRSFRGDSRFTTWAQKFVVLEAAAKVRKASWRGRELPLEADGWAQLHDHGRACPDAEAEAFEVIGAVRDAIAEVLTPHQRAVLVALTLNDVPIDVLAERRATNRNALYKTLHDARRKLRARLAQDGLAIEGQAA
jgi:RNA polymerase sigma-70 factor (ECF subfamily)